MVCEFHVHSEHKIHGKQYDMEFECWFANPNPVSTDTNSLINTARASFIIFQFCLKNKIMKKISLNYLILQLTYFIKVIMSFIHVLHYTNFI